MGTDGIEMDEVRPSREDDAGQDDAAQDGGAGDEDVVGARLFQALAVFFVVLAGIYWITADGEYAGVALLLLTGGLSLITGAFLEHAMRNGLRQELAVEDYDRPGDLYLPHASLQPLVMGGGIVLLAAGLPLGIWVLIPGGLLLLFGLVGWIQEGRTR